MKLGREERGRIRRGEEAKIGELRMGQGSRIDWQRVGRNMKARTQPERRRDKYGDMNSESRDTLSWYIALLLSAEVSMYS